MDISRSGTGEHYRSKHGERATLPKNGQIWPLPGRVRFAWWDSPKPLLSVTALSIQPRKV